MRLWRFVGIGVLLFGVMTFVACSQNRPNLQDHVSTALKSANIRDVDVDYDKDTRVVHLKGSVENRAERARAQEVAERAVGTSGKVLNEVTVNGVDDKTADENDGRIKNQLKEMVDRDPNLKERDITFDVNNGVVEVKGWVASDEEKGRVSDMIHQVAGVRNFANALEIRPDKAPRPAGRPATNRTGSQNGPDLQDHVSTALKSANIRHVDVDYDKDARVVHLKGTVDSRAERARAEEVAERAVGTLGKVLNEVTVKGIDDKTADENDGRIKSQLKEMVDRDPNLKERDITFDVNNGVVEVKGWVASAEEKGRVSDMMHSVTGIRNFVNALEIRPEKASSR